MCIPTRRIVRFTVYITFCGETYCELETYTVFDTLRFIEYDTWTGEKEL